MKLTLPGLFFVVVCFLFGFFLFHSKYSGDDKVIAIPRYQISPPARTIARNVVTTIGRNETFGIIAFHEKKNERVISNKSVSFADPTLHQWKERHLSKVCCLHRRKLAIYLYHARKAAGTTIRDIFRLVAFRQKVPFFETEGIVLKQQILDTPGLFSVLTLRHPVNRVISLYWYEHVGWYAGVLRQPQRCKSLKEWIETWKDGSAHKNAILKKLPENNYVEIQNYYTKLLVGYTPNENRELDANDLVKAKETLRKFDLLLITEWLNDDSEISVLHQFNRMFNPHGKEDFIAPQKVKGDVAMKAKLLSRLSPNEEELRERLQDINKMDLELYEFAKSLAAVRLKELHGSYGNCSQEVLCPHIPHSFVSKNKNLFGVFQPPGHKGP